MLAAADFERPGRAPARPQAAPKSNARVRQRDRAAALELFDAGSGDEAVPAAKAPPTLIPTAARPTPDTTRAAAAPRALRRAGKGPAKLFVLDTNVLMHDPMCLFRFEEHDIFLPMIVLEELDGHKKGMTEVARNARQASRTLDALAAHRCRRQLDPKAGIALNTTGHREAGGYLFFQTTLLDIKLPEGLPQGKADNQILGVVQALREQQRRRHRARWCWCPRTSTCASRRARWAWPADDYQNDKTLDDGDLLYSGSLALPADFWERTARPWKAGSKAATPSTASAGRSCRPADQPVRLSSRRPASRACTRA